jgi:hypothetical protein
LPVFFNHEGREVDGKDRIGGIFFVLFVAFAVKYYSMKNWGYSTEGSRSIRLFRNVGLDPSAEFILNAAEVLRTSFIEPASKRA